VCVIGLRGAKKAKVSQFEKPAKRLRHSNTKITQLLGANFFGPSFQAFAFAESQFCRQSAYPIVLMYGPVSSNKVEWTGL
jgi:hypothetical protein